jgi:hypothetical protein
MPIVGFYCSGVARLIERQTLSITIPYIKKTNGAKNSFRIVSE